MALPLLHVIPMRTYVGLLALLALTGTTSPAWGAPDGAALYRLRCAPCHGEAGRGNGPDAHLFTPPPRDLQSGFLGQYDTATLVRRVLDGARLPLALDLPALRARARDVEAIAAYLERLPTIDWRLVEPGEEIYVDRCELCHGPAGRPPADLPPGVRTPRDLSDPAFQRAMSDAALAEVVRHGRAGMPALTPRISAIDTSSLVAFVRLLSPGYEQYERYCAACHGEDGRGAGSFAEAIPRPPVVFDRDYFVRRDPEQIRAAVWHMLDRESASMPHFRGTLTESDAAAIVDYLRRAPATPTGRTSPKPAD